MKKEKKKIKTIGKILGILIGMIILLLLIIAILPNRKVSKMPTEINNIEELLTYYKCKNITIRNVQEEDFKTDIYLTFGEDLWSEDKSNEAYYTGIILHLTELLQYQNYRMIDSSRELVIAVEANYETKKTERIYINGEVNYFAKEATKQMLKQYKEIETTNFEIQAEEIQEMIQNDWDAKRITFGTVESRCNDYDIYFDEGLEVKTLGGKVYNLVFTQKYQKNIMNQLKVNAEKERIIQTLGKPTFEAESVIGYKGKECYVFFSENQVSVYRREKEYQTEEFLKLWETFIQNKETKSFVYGLTDLWKDYNQFHYDSNYIFLEYALKGICIQFNMNDENGIILYNNYEGNLGKDITIKNMNIDTLPEHVYLHTNEDLVFMEETKRVTAQEYYYVEEYRNMSNENYYLEEEYQETFRFTERKSEEFYLDYEYVPKEGIREVRFISLSRNFPNSELTRHKKINYYGWLNDEQFVYSVSGEGIYYYNAKTRKLRALLTGNEPYVLKKIEADTLFYDETSLKLR